MTAPFLEVRDIRKVFPGVVALKGANLTIERGQVIGLVGKNGAGKSTLMKTLAGVVVPDEGEVLVDGEAVDIRTPHDATALGLAFVHQELSQADVLTVAESVLLGLGYPKRGPIVRRRALEARAGAILARLDPDIPLHVPVRQLSPAQQRLVMIAHALAQDARLLVLDEPSAALADDEIAQLHAIVERLASEGVAVVYISHRLDEILAVSSRVVVMRDAQIVGDVPTATLTRETLVSQITGGATEIARTRAERARPAPLRDGRPVLSYEDDTSRIPLTVHRGEILGLAGMVGSGRTELVRTIFGAGGRPSGMLQVDGETRRVRSPADAIDAGVVLLPEDRRREGNLVEFSVERNLTLASLSRHRLARRLPVPARRSERIAADAAIRDLAVRTPSADAAVSTLSGGNQQKVMLGKWLALDARVYIFDEPTQGIDVGAKEEAFSLIDDLAARGKGVVLVSSDFSELVAMCDRVLVLKEGRIVSEHGGADITEAALVEACYVAA